MAAAAAAAKIALVTGGNKGIGLAIVKGLAARGDVHVLLGARDAERGQKAVAELAAKNVSFLKVDIDDEKSIEAAAAEVQNKYKGLDILVNNAAIAFKGDAFDENVARTTFHTNYFGTVHMLKHFLPLVRPHGRVVNVSSVVGVGALGRCKPDLQQKFLKPDLTLDELNALMNQFIEDVKTNTWEQKGWPKTSYGMSKVGVNMLTRILARDTKTEDLIISAVNPGYVATDMSSFKGHLTTEQGAETPLMCCFLPAGSPNGAYFSENKQGPYV